MKSVLLIGIGGVYNYGCEAIVRGTEAILRSEWPEIRVVYASGRPKDDQERLTGCNVEIAHRQLLGRRSLPNVARKLLSLVGVRWEPMLDSVALLNGHDVVLSVGGDIYTLFNGCYFDASLCKFGDAAEKRGIPYVLWGASVGPFTRSPQAERYFKRHLSRIRLVTARERDTIEYLSSLGVVSNVVSCADPAFAVAPEIVAGGKAVNAKLTFGINLSPLSLRHSGLSLEQGVEVHALAIKKIIERYDAKVILIPHVVCDFKQEDDDRRYLQQIKSKIYPEYDEGRLSVLDTDPGFIGVKRVLAQCDMVIAARMHCAINAMAAHAPSLLLSYSQKAKGICEYVYGHRNWVHPLSEFGSDACLATIAEMLASRKDIQAYLAKRIPQIRAESFRPIEALKKISSTGGE